MELLQWCKMQIVCLVMLGYIGIIYIREGCELNKIAHKHLCRRSFDTLLVTADLALLFDGVTACTVNMTETVPHTVNLLLHAGMYLAYECYIAILFWYWLEISSSMIKRKMLRWLFFLPCAVLALLTILSLPTLRFVPGSQTNYSMGLPVYLCFACILIYCAMSIALIILRRRSFSKDKLFLLGITLSCVILILALQIAFPEFLPSGIAITLITISIYLNMENPSIKELEHYHNEMVMGFATLIDNKDDSTGGHIRRSSAYAVLIAENLRRLPQFKNMITRDFRDNLRKSAPMHDVGKIGIPDAILQKPGKLTDEEYEIMKEHPLIGGKIIRETFGNLGRKEYEAMAWEIASYHHEKWNGRGYPYGLKELEIPLPARIMAVADVFDAVSAKRCYRDALPIDVCYDIIRKGRGTDFDPDIVDAFFADTEKIEKILRHEFESN